jgi:hypothetical protein
LPNLQKKRKENARFEEDADGASVWNAQERIHEILIDYV